MGYYKNATICINGHVSSSIQANSDEYCWKCGEKTISTCQHCNKYIQGDYYSENVAFIGFTYNKPAYCVYCGKPFPWTEYVLNNAIELISLDDELPLEQKEIIKNAFPDLIVETPATPVAVAKYKKYIPKAATYVQEGVKNILLDVVSETVKKSLWG